GRGGEGRDSGRDLGRDLGRDPGQPAHHDNGGPRHTEFAPDSMGGMPQPGGDDRPAAGGAEYGEPFAPGHQNGSDVHADGDGNGDSERRRRRHGRRGGRRNRRDRDDQAPGEFAAGPGQQDRETHAAHPDDTQRAPWREAADSQPRWSEPAPVPDIAQAEMPPRIEPPAAAAASAPVVPPPAPEPARRRSTVREPAPLFVTGEPAVTPMPSPQPAPPSPAASEQAADDAGKPRRTGWWARRMMGGDKG
ncbi:MAG: hypothetical protein FJX62_20365, partial [Alphaproteobacteria bacterium]|nr:hypothetical protein [Alphaproteobacteria bacterium]